MPLKSRNDYFLKIWGGMAPLAPPGYAYDYRAPADGIVRWPAADPEAKSEIVKPHFPKI